MSAILNVPEKEISKMFSFPLKTLRRLRNNHKFNKDICFTLPSSTRILYNIDKFKSWFDDNKFEAHVDLNAMIKESRARFLMSNPQFTRKGTPRKRYV